MFARYCSFAFTVGSRMTARDSCPPLDVLNPLRTLNGSPVIKVWIEFIVQPPITWFSQPGALPASHLLLPTGNSHTVVRLKTCVRSKSERALSSRRLRMSVGVRELVVDSPPPDDAPTGSTD